MKLLLLALVLSGCSGLLYYPSSQLFLNPNQKGYAPESVFLPLKDKQTQVHGWYFKTKNPKGAKGVIIFFHGNAENVSSHYLTGLFFVEAGYDLLIFDYPGFGSSTGKSSPASTVETGEAFLSWLSQHKPNLPWVVFGQSLGGAVAMKVLIDAPRTYPIRFAIIDSSFASYKTVSRKVLASTWLTWPFQWLAWLLMSDEFAPKGSIGKISPIPLLVIHGNRDQTVAFELGKAVFEEAKEPKTFWEISGGNHTDVFFRENGKYQKKILELLDQNLG